MNKFRKRISKELNAITQNYLATPQIGEDQERIWIGTVECPFYTFEFSSRGIFLAKNPKKFFVQGFWGSKHLDGVFLAERETTVEEYLIGLKIQKYIIFAEN